MQLRFKLRSRKFFAIAAAFVALVVTPAPAISVTMNDVDDLIDRLDAAEWAERDAATRALLEHGVAAVPSLYARVPESSPEAQHRIRWLLDRLDPPVQVLRLLRWEASTEAGPWRCIEYCDQEVRGLFESTNIVPNVVSDAAPLTGSPEIGVTVAVAGPTVSLEAEFSNPGTDPIRLPLELAPGQIALLREEAGISVEVRGCQVRRTVRDYAWTVELLASFRESERPSLDADLDSARAATHAFDVALSRQLERGPVDAIAAVRIATLLNRKDWIVANRPAAVATSLDEGTDSDASTPDTSQPTLETLSGWWRLASATAEPGDAARVEALETWVAEHERPLDDVLQASACELLIALGREVGLDRLLPAVTEVAPWVQFRILHAFTVALHAGRVEADRVRWAFETLTSPELFEYLSWRGDQLTTEVLQLLAARLEPSHAQRVLSDRLSEASAAEWAGAARLVPLLRTLRLLEEAEDGDAPDSEERVDVMFQLLEYGTSFEYAFCWIRDRLLDGRFGDAEWQRLLETSEKIYALEAGPSYQLDLLLESLAQDPRLGSSRAREIWLLRARSLRLVPSNRRWRANTELETRFGKASATTIPAHDDDAWTARSHEWEARIRELPESDFAAEPETRERARLTEVDLRIEDGAVTVLSFWHGEVPVEVAVTRTSDEGRDDTILLTRDPNPRVQGFRLNRSTIRYQYPRTSANPRRYLAQTWEFARGDYAPRYFNRTQRGGVAEAEFKSILYLEPIESPPRPDWPSVVAAWVTAASDPSLAKVHLDAIADAQLRSALPALTDLYERSPSNDLALTLYSLGDSRGRDRLFEQVESASPQVAAPIAISLLDQGDSEVVRVVLEWFQDEDRMRFLRGTSWQLVSGLEKYALDHRAEVSEEQELWVRGMVGALTHRNTAQVATRVLRSVSGLDFGFEDATRQLNGQERVQAQDSAIQKWQSWADAEYPSPK